MNKLTRIVGDYLTAFKAKEIVLNQSTTYNPNDFVLRTDSSMHWNHSAGNTPIGEMPKKNREGKCMCGVPFEVHGTVGCGWNNCAIIILADGTSKYPLPDGFILQDGYIQYVEKYEPIDFKVEPNEIIYFRRPSKIELHKIPYNEKTDENH